MIGTHWCQWQPNNSDQVSRLATAATKSREILFQDCFELMFCVVVFCFAVVVVVVVGGGGGGFWQCMP